MWEGNDGEDGATLLSPTVSGSWSDGGGGGGRDGGDAGRSGAGARRGAGTAACPDGPAGAPKTSPRGTAADRAGVRPRHLGRGHRLVPQLDGRRPRLLPAPRPVRRADAPRQVPARRGPPAAGEREPAQRVVLEVLDQGRALRDARGQARRDQGQRVRGGDPDDERLERAGGVRARRGRDGRDADPRCRGRDRREGRVRAPVLLRREPYLGHRARAKPSQPQAVSRRLVERERGVGGRPRGRHGARRRPGRVDPDSELLLRGGGAQGHLRARALHRGLPDRAHAGPHRAHRPVRGRLRAAPRGDRGPGRPRSAPAVDGPHGPLYPRPHRRRPGSPRRDRPGGVRLARRVGAGRRPPRARGGPAAQPGRGHGDRRLGPAPPRRHPHLERHRGRGGHHAHGRRQQHGNELEGALHDLAPGLLRAEPAGARQRPV